MELNNSACNNGFNTMLKFYCDKCKKEIESKNRYNIKIYNFTYLIKTLHYCEGCYKELYENTKH